MKVTGILTLGWMLQWQSAVAKSVSSPTFLPQRTLLVANSEQSQSATFSDILQVRGGAKKKRKGKTATLSSSRTATGKKKVQSGAKKEKKSTLEDGMQKYKQILPLTRIYITMVFGATLLGMVLGEELTQGAPCFL